MKPMQTKKRNIFSVPVKKFAMSKIARILEFPFLPIGGRATSIVFLAEPY
jgi:hypothetical protein